MKFFNLGATELVLIILFAILAVGPKETLRYAGQAREIIKAVQGTISELTSEVSRVAADVMEPSEDKKNDS